MTAVRLYIDIAARLWPAAAVPPLAWLIAGTVDRWTK